MRGVEFNSGELFSIQLRPQPLWSLLWVNGPSPGFDCPHRSSHPYLTRIAFIGFPRETFIDWRKREKIGVEVVDGGEFSKFHDEHKLSLVLCEGGNKWGDYSSFLRCMKMLYALRDIIFPRHCVLCEIWMVDDQFHVPVCSLCVWKWPDLRGSIGGQLLLERLCLRWGHVGFRLRESSFLEQEVRAIKYRGAIRQARNWGAWLAQFSEPPHGSLNNVVLVPVPLHWKKKN